ncbi:MAG: DUF4349 domain-containing protein [Oscillospiraceae bacterium]|jgi:hypothetical protein|nr:DUF4349 domain-containing protein [Oscillospiraceae bacterium]
MKKTIALVLSVALAVALLTSCAASNKSYAPLIGSSPENGKYDGSYADSPAAGYYDDSYESYDYAVAESANAEPPMAPSATSIPKDMGGVGYTSNTSSGTLITASSFAEKIIYSASANVETVEFDKTVADVDAMIAQYAGFIENSYIGGRDYYDTYYGYNSYRSASYTIRVPVASYEEMTNSLSSLGNVTYLRNDAQNITAQYTDTESRVKTYRIEEERLLSMLEKADTVTDMITIEARLSDVRYNLENYEAQMRNMQNQVDYSAVYLNISEVEKLSPKEEIHRTYWQQVGDGLKQTFVNIGDFFKDLLKGIIVYIPIIVICVIVAVVIIVAVKKRVKSAVKPAITDKTEDK